MGWSTEAVSAGDLHSHEIWFAFSWRRKTSLGRWRKASAGKEQSRCWEGAVKGRAGCYRLGDKQEGDLFFGSVLQQRQERGANAAFQSP